MAYTSDTGDINDSAWRAQAVSAFAGDYIIDGCGTSVGDSTTSIETTVESGVVRFDNDVIEVTQQTVTHPDGPAPGSGPEGGDPARVDLVTVDSNGNAGRMTGTPAVPDPDNRRFPNVTQPVPPTPQPSDDVVASAALWVPNGTGASSELFNDYVIPREVMGDGLNDLDLIPGRDLQYVLDNAREGETLRGDRSQTITLDQPLTITTPDLTLRDVTLRYADQAATNDTDDMITVEAADVTIEDTTLLGNKQNQTAEPDGITIKASRASSRGIRLRDHAGVGINVNGGSTSFRDTTIERIQSYGGDKTAIVVQGDVSATEIDKVFSRQGGAGTVLVRNGPGGTVMRTIKAQDQTYGVRFADFGAGNESTAPITNTRIDGLSVAGCDQAIDSNDVDGSVGHRKFRISDVRTTGMTTPDGTNPVAMARVDEVHIKDSDITGSFAGWPIAFSAVSNSSVRNTTVGTDAAGYGGVFVYNSDFVSITECIADAPSGSVESAYRFANGSDTARVMRITDCDAESDATNGIEFAEQGGEFDRVLIQGNAVPNIYDGQITGSKTVTGNI